jgi:type III restriction enzyme
MSPAVSLTFSAFPARSSIEPLRALHPDFIIFTDVGGTIRPSIVDPHGHHLEDALVKLVGLAEYAEAYGSGFLRIDALADVSGDMRVLDLQDLAVRDAVRAASTSGQTAFALYQLVGKKYA